MISQPNFYYHEKALTRDLLKDMVDNQLEPEGEIIANNYWHKDASYRDGKHIEVAYRANFTYRNQKLILTAEYYLVAPEYPNGEPVKFTYSSE